MYKPNKYQFIYNYLLLLLLLLYIHIQCYPTSHRRTVLNNCRNNKEEFITEITCSSLLTFKLFIYFLFSTFQSQLSVHWRMTFQCNIKI